MKYKKLFNFHRHATIIVMVFCVFIMNIESACSQCVQKNWLGICTKYDVGRLPPPPPQPYCTRLNTWNKSNRSFCDCIRSDGGVSRGCMVRMDTGRPFICTDEAINAFLSQNVNSFGGSSPSCHKYGDLCRYRISDSVHSFACRATESGFVAIEYTSPR